MDEELLLKPMFLQQGEIMIKVGGVPVIPCSSQLQIEQVAQVLNFLRCGAPAVQVLVSIMNPSEFGQFLAELSKILHELSLPDEVFWIDRSDDENDSSFRICSAIVNCLE